jgi:hypothetical protein
MAQKLSFYCELPTIFDLMARYGERLEDMNFNSLLTFRAVVDLFVLYYSREIAGSVEQNFDLAVENCYPDWGMEDQEAYTLCRAFCLEEVDGNYTAIHSLNPVLKGLADVVPCHPDY